MKLQCIYLFIMAELLIACSELTDTPNNVPVVGTGDVKSVTAHSATIGIEGIDYDYYYMEVSTSPSFPAEDTQKCHRLDGNWIVNGLLSGTVYYYRQYATDGISIINGPTKQFETLPMVGIASILLAPWNETVGEKTVTDIEIGLFYSEVSTGKDKSGFTNFQTKYNPETNFWSLPNEIAPTDSIHRFYAYAPYYTYATDKKNIPVDLKYNTDVLCGQSGDITTANYNAAITMHHTLARVIFNVTKDVKSNTDFSVSEYVLISGLDDFRFPISGSLNLVTSNFDNFKVYNNLPRYIQTTTLTEKPVAMEFYLIPFEFADEQLNLQLVSNDNNIKTVPIPASSWQAGMQYEYPVIVRQNCLEIGDVTITPWTDNDGGDIIIKN